MPARLICLLAACALAGCGTSQPPQAQTAETPSPEQLAEENELLAEQRETAELEQQLAQAQQAGRTVTPPADTPAAATTSRAAAGRDGGLLSAADQARFRELEQTAGPSGVTVSAIGRDRPQSSAGSLDGGPAWSTIKAPMAVAALRRGPAPAAHAAITASDNAAADRLWQSLGAGQAAGRAVERVLRDTGDARTQVQTQKTRAQFSAYGQTPWTLAAQTRFAAGLACVDQGPEVLGLMDQVISSQRWGMGATGRDAQFKGGWGPDDQGRYLVRQTGVIVLAGGRPLAVSIANQPADGQMSTGAQNLTRIAKWVASHVRSSKLSRRPRC